MEIIEGKTYRIALRLPWGELIEFECASVSRSADGAITWLPDREHPLEPRVSNFIKETGNYAMGWLGDACDAVAVISEGADAPVP